jgi:hypothetical protein
MKLPSLQFYPGDWRKDVGIQSLTYHDRGVWFEILMLMHESEKRGVLILNGRAMSDEVLARVLGLDKQILTTTLTSLLECGVASRDDETGALINRRMVRDEKLRKVRAEAGKKGGNPVLLKQNQTTWDKQILTTGDKPILTPSSSSSSSIDKYRPSVSESLPEWLPTEAWNGFVEMRKQKKKPLTDRAKQIILRQLDALRANGENPAEILDRSTMHGWTGIFTARGNASALAPESKPSEPERPVFNQRSTLIPLSEMRARAGIQ